MERNTQQTIEDFKRTAQELIYMALALCEERIHAAPESDVHSYATAIKSYFPSDFYLQSYLFSIRSTEGASFIMSKQI